MKAKLKTRPEQLQNKTIKEASEEHKDSLHKINKHSVSVHSAGDGSASGELGGVFVPNTEQVAKINQFTKKTVTADDVVAFSIDAMNDLYDRDDEKFTTETVKEFAALPQPFSFIGKSYMADHDYKMDKVRGRIFDVGVKGKQTDLGHASFLQSHIYTANTPQYHDFIENLEFGLNWAVSVGVVVDKSECSICNAPVYTSRFFGWWSWCENGHEKGLYYVPGKEEEDSWGYLLPVDPSTRGAVKAMVDLKDAVDGYEISQVFLGAQYMAQLSDKSVQKVFARAGRSKLPVLGVSQAEADLLNLPSEPKEVIEARQKYEIEIKDGAFYWKDAGDLRWKYDPEEGDSVLCLGKTGDNIGSDLESELAKSIKSKVVSLRALSERAKQAEGETDDEDDDPVELAESLDAILDEVDEAFDNNELDQAEALLDGAETVVDQLLDVLGGTDADEADDNEDQNSSVLMDVCENCGHQKGSTGQGVSESKWDGSASRFTDEQYKMSCAVCRGENSDAPKTDCSLPHHEPDGKVNRNGVHAAAGRIDQTDLTDEQKSKAKSHLKSHYTKDLKEEVPDSLKDAKSTGHQHSHSHDGGSTSHSHMHSHSSGNYDHTAADPEVAHEHSHENNTTTEGVELSGKEVLSAALKAKLPQDVLDKLADAPGNGLSVLLKECSRVIKDAQSEVSSLKPKAELGDRYVAELETDALHWFTVSRRDPNNPETGVNVEFAKKMIERCKRDPEMLKELIDDYKSEARKRFPQPTRRSTVPEDPNERPEHLPNPQFGPQEQDRRTKNLVSRLHATGRK